MVYEIIVQLRAEVASEVRQHRQTQAAKSVVDLAVELKVELTPQGSEGEGELSTFFSIMLHDDEQARRIVQRFADCEGVSAAYIKPMGEPPQG